MKFLNRVRGTFDTATRKSQDALEINKLNTHMKKLEEEADRLYVSIGQKIYRDPVLAKQETKNHVNTQVHSLELLNRQIHEAKRKVLFLKDLVECDSCQKIVSVSTKYCPDCGNNIAELVKKTSKYLALEDHDRKES